MINNENSQYLFHSYPPKYKVVKNNVYPTLPYLSKKYIISMFIFIIKLKGLRITYEAMVQNFSTVYTV